MGRKRLSSRRFFVVAALVLKPFGPVDALLEKNNPWQGFLDDGPLLTVIRAQKVSAPAGAKDFCKRWTDALMADKVGVTLTSLTPAAFEKAAEAWRPWDDDDIDGFESCTQSPCVSKLDEDEAKQMGAVKKADRRAKFLSLILSRVQGYQKSGLRKGYEYPGTPADPWKHFEEVGFVSPLTKPDSQKLEIRKINFLPGKVRTVHQIFDTRVAKRSEGSQEQATLWRRDAYSDHYFDSWGEWVDVRCLGSEVVVVQAMMLELDLLKKTDVLSKVMRPKMRGSSKEGGESYLEKWFERLKKRAS